MDLLAPDPARRQRFEAAIGRFDAANRADPRREVFAGQEYPQELLYSRRMTRWLERLAPDASEPLRLAARCQHLCRWMIPRSDYPMDRLGYHRWRNALKEFHAQQATEILRGVGYDHETIARVQALVRKERLTTDPETQTLEDVICLVFLESYFSDFARRHPEEKLATVLQKTWKKMSPTGRQTALELDLRPEDRALIERALAAESH